MSRKFQQIREISAGIVATGKAASDCSRLAFLIGETFKACRHGLLRKVFMSAYMKTGRICVKKMQIDYATTKGRHVYSDVHYEPDCFIMFGKERCCREFRKKS